MRRYLEVALAGPLCQTADTINLLLPHFTFSRGRFMVLSPITVPAPTPTPRAFARVLGKIASVVWVVTVVFGLLVVAHHVPLTTVQGDGASMLVAGA